MEEPARGVSARPSGRQIPPPSPAPYQQWQGARRPLGFLGSRPPVPAWWLAALILLAGDVERNPGPQTYTCSTCNNNITKTQTSIRCNHATTHWIHLKCSNITRTQYNSKWICQEHLPNLTHHNQHKRNTKPSLTPPIPQNNGAKAPSTCSKQKTPTNQTLTFIQININGIRKKLTELKHFTTKHKADILCIQETKLNKNHKTPEITNYTPIRTDRKNSIKGGGLITYIHKNHKFQQTESPSNYQHIEHHTFKIYTDDHKHITITNAYLPPTGTDINAQTFNTEMEHFFTNQFTTNTHLILTDANAHSPSWHSTLQDTRGNQLADILDSSNYVPINTNTSTRLPTAHNQQTSSPDITIVHNSVAPYTTWQAITDLSSDHLPIKITLTTKHQLKPVNKKPTFTNYRKADWLGFTQHIEQRIREHTSQLKEPETVHTANHTITTIILEADKRYIPKGVQQAKTNILPENIRALIRNRNSIRQSNHKDPQLPNLNTEINKQIAQHKQNIWKEKISGDWSHTKNTHILWNTIKTLSDKQKTHNHNITINFSGKPNHTDKDISNAFNKHFTTPQTHKTDKTYRSTTKQTKKLETQAITITTEQTNTAIEASQTNNSLGPDNINIRHLKHLGPHATQYLTNIYNQALNRNIIPMIWKTANIIPIPKYNKDIHEHTSYRPISLLSPIAKVLEKILLSFITEHIQKLPFQHGFKKQHSTATALHQINNTITKGFNQQKPPLRTITTSLDMSKAFDTVNIHTLIQKLISSNIPNLITKFIANYIKGRQSYTTYNGYKSHTKINKSGVPQGSVLSPTLFNIYTSDIPQPTSKHIDMQLYADDITITSTHQHIQTAADNLQPFLDDIAQWTKDNNLQINPSKTQLSLSSPDSKEYKAQLPLQIHNTPLSTQNHNKILGVTIDTQHTYTQHVNDICNKANKTLNILRCLTATKWGQQKETLLTTYKTITRPILEYASTTWSPTISQTNIDKLQVIQNKALRIATGCTQDTPIQHLHNESKILPIKEHLTLHATQFLHKTKDPEHPLHELTKQTTPKRQQKTTLFINNNYLNPYLPNSQAPPSPKSIKLNMKHSHTKIVQTYLSNRQPNKILQATPPPVHPSEQQLDRPTRRTLAQIRSNHSPFLKEYLHKINPALYSSPLCPLCKSQPHNTAHIFSCTHIQTNLSPRSLWTEPLKCAALLKRWEQAVGDP